MSFEVQLKLAKYIPDGLIKGLDISYDNDEFGQIFTEKRSNPKKDFQVFEKKSDGTYAMAQNADQLSKPESKTPETQEKQQQNSENNEKGSQLSDKAKGAQSKQLTALASMLYSVDALPVPQTGVVQFVKEVLVKAVVEVQKSEGAQYKFSFDKQDLPLEITIKKVENKLEIRLNANKELYDMLKPEMKNLYAYLKAQNEEDIVMNLQFVDNLGQEQTDTSESDTGENNQGFNSEETEGGDATPVEFLDAFRANSTEKS